MTTELSEKDKEAFEEWYREYRKGGSLYDHQKESWQAACEYKDKETRLNLAKLRDEGGLFEINDATIACPQEVIRTALSEIKRLRKTVLSQEKERQSSERFWKEKLEKYQDKIKQLREALDWATRVIESSDHLDHYSDNSRYYRDKFSLNSLKESNNSTTKNSSKEGV